MKLKQFINELEKILENIDNPETIEVQMADCIPVVSPILKNKTVFITDIEENKEMKNYKKAVKRAARTKKLTKMFQYFNY